MRAREYDGTEPARLQERLGRSENGAGHVPDDRSRVVTTDWGPLSTHVGCSVETAERIQGDAERILGDAEPEALPVTAQTRVDRYADRPGRCRRPPP
ncbi:hypothetical protein ABZS61_13690 [Streptomyces sp. NPDC005566]|uniref:hypothetical protein n=1 Tax=Streptomyces sp. NPDC005566 TaxID=3156886 RepID=UPI0033B0C014